MGVNITDQPARPSLHVLEQLREDGEMRLVRCRPEGGTAQVLVVTPVHDHPQEAIIKRLEHEYALRAELDPAWTVYPIELRYADGRMLLVLEDPGGEPLARLLGVPMTVGSFLAQAAGIAAALGKLHARGLVHKDLKPAHLLVNCADGQVRLTGLGLASRLPRERQVPAPPEFIAGTLAYMAPEQTGRMNRSIDFRSDLYALGVVLYQMLTGALPFTASDPMEWVHCHIARKPVPPSERLETIPAPVSQIIMKLLAKTAEERYQTASGVEADLRRCLADWEAQGRIDDFPPGKYDTPDRLLIPEQLYGRAREVETLLAAFDRIVFDNSAPELVLVSGYSGIGKSAVVNELHKVLVPPRGLFAMGKFDQYKRDIPYAPLAQAFQGLLRPLMGLVEAELAGWREALREALGPNAKLMVDLVPELKLITGEPPPVPELPPQQARTRFQMVFRRFLGVFARPDHPLVLFLDDLQWLDPATLDLLEDLVTQPEVRHLLLIGAYRDKEVDVIHPLARKLEAIRQAGGRLAEISLAPLACADVQQLIADALHCGPEETAPLAQLVHEKTGGNPFFAIQFLHALADAQLLTFDHDAACWCWDLDRIHAKGYTDNVVDLMVGKLTRLPTATQTALQLLACLGNVADTPALCLMRGTSEQAVHADLWEAVRQELILHQEDVYKFVHDRIQEAAYSLIPVDLRAAAHLRIGRLLAAHTPLEKRDEAIFEIVNQLNRGGALIIAQDEREQLAELNLIAGRRAQLSTAYASALTYLVAGAALLAEDCWERRHELAFALELDRAECEFRTGALGQAEERLAALSIRAANTVDRATVACLRVDLYTTLDRSSRAGAVGLDYLRHLGIEWSPQPTDEDVRREYDRIWLQLGSCTIEDLIELPLMTDTASLATMDVLTKIIVPTLYTDANLHFLVTCRAVNLSLEQGNCDASCIAYVWLSMIASARFGEYQTLYRFGRLGYDLVEGCGLTRFQARVYMDFAYGVLPWTRHVRAGRDLLRRAFEAANKVGDLVYAGYCCNQLNTNLLMAGDQLAEVEREAEHGLAFAQRARFGLVVDRIATQLGLIRTLRGLTPTFGCFNDAQFDESRFERHLAGNPDLVRAEFLYWVRKLQAHFFAGNYASAIAASSRAQPLLWTSVSQLEKAEYYFYGALAQAASCKEATTGEQQQCLDLVAGHHKQLQLWAVNCPDNFENSAALVGAEIACLEGRELDAERLYEQAIRSARANGFTHNEALANELAASFYATRGFKKIARVYLQDARYGYLRWGADGKVRQLEQAHPWLREESAPLLPTATVGTALERLELAAVVRAAQALSGEIFLDRLIQTLMTLALEHAGAERGMLIVLRGEVPQVVAEARADKTVELVRRQEAVAPDEMPATILRTVLRTRESVILDDAAAPNPFSVDVYLQEKRVRSVLCLPLLKQAELIGLLYLENNLASHVFTPARIALLELLAAQAAISLENARLYTDLLRENRDRQMAEEAMRASEARWRSLFENVPVGVALLGSHGRYVEANPAFCTMTGYSEAELQQFSPADITHEDDRAATEALLAARATGMPYEPRVEKRYRRKDGGIIWVELSAFVAPIGAGAPLYAGAVVDITERKRAETALRRSETYLAEAQRLSRTGSFGWNVSSGVIFWSEESFDIFGYDKAPSATIAMVLQRVHPDDLALAHRMIEHASSTGSNFDFEHRLLMPDGAVRYVHVVGRAVRDQEGELEFIGSVMDVTAAKRGEESLHKAQADLAHATRVTTLGELAASIAHEINQPLAAVATSGNACLRWLTRDPPDLNAARQAVARIVQDAHRAGDVIHSLRTLAVKSGPQLTELDVNGAIQEVLVLTRGDLHRHGVALHTDLFADLRPVMGDKVQLQQVLLNLITNAVDAMAEVTDRAKMLLITAHPAQPDGVLVSVEDTGTGFDPATADQIFAPFYTTKSSGMGMGLSICKTIIEGRGGQLWAKPNQPHGAIFQFRLPGAGRKVS